LEEERRREREQKETEERRKQRMLKRRRIKQFGSAIVGGVFGVLFTALRNKKQSIKKKR
jgi:cell division septal protein FtsQ